MPTSPSYIDQTIEDPAGELQQVRVHIGESPLLWLYARGHLSERLYLAGERLRHDWERAGLGARVTMAWDAAPPSRGRRGAAAAIAPGHAQLTAREHFHAALDRAGPGLKDVLWRVVCAGEGLSAAERALGWPTRAAKLVLIFALERVADYYRVG
ncbi:MAG: DUF6456 domain-containing protein [Sphingobium sp.]|jgi:hypothetical protein|nr:DUF6456 domain-containing protein [Sphingobium sp.]MCI1272227.1 DUF6456 domain-containing protein [Sphingobium sp.]MCI2054023.1 DUF6456 domain-containing protein [Sphingobium sp.]